MILNFDSVNMLPVRFIHWLRCLCHVSDVMVRFFYQLYSMHKTNLTMGNDQLEVNAQDI